MTALGRRSGVTGKIRSDLVHPVATLALQHNVQRNCCRFRPLPRRYSGHFDPQHFCQPPTKYVSTFLTLLYQAPSKQRLRSSHELPSDTCPPSRPSFSTPVTRCPQAHANDKWPMQPPLVPPALSRLLAVLAAAFAVTLYTRYNHRQKRRLYVSLDNAGLTIPSPSLTSQ